MTDQKDVPALFLEFSVTKLTQMTTEMRKCLERLSDAQMWQRGGPHENAIGNLVLHLEGNMRQWILFGVAKQPDVRVRDAEFAAEGGMTRDELLAKFEKTVEEAKGVIAALPAARLTERTNPQRGEISVLEVIYQVVGHVQLHVGQIVVLTKQMVGIDLDLSMPRPR